MVETRTNGFSTRLDNAPAAIGLKRFEADGVALWRLQITRHPGSVPVLIDVDATVQAIRDLEQFCARARGALVSDGGRIPQDKVA